MKNIFHKRNNETQLVAADETPKFAVGNYENIADSTLEYTQETTQKIRELVTSLVDANVEKPSARNNDTFNKVTFTDGNEKVLLSKFAQAGIGSGNYLEYQDGDVIITLQSGSDNDIGRQEGITLYDIVDGSEQFRLEIGEFNYRHTPTESLGSSLDKTNEVMNSIGKSLSTVMAKGKKS